MEASNREEVLAGVLLKVDCRLKIKRKKGERDDFHSKIIVFIHAPFFSCALLPLKKYNSLRRY